MKEFINDIRADDGKVFVGSRVEKGKPTKIFVQNEINKSNFDFLSSDIVSEETKRKFLDVNSIVFKKGRSLSEIIKIEDENNFKGWKINVVTWADNDKVTFKCWGDYWVKQKILKTLLSFGCEVDVEMQDADLTIYLFGSPFNYRIFRPYNYNPMSYNVCWFYSHPDKMNRREAFKYDYIFCLSKDYTEKLYNETKHPFISKEPLFSCTDFSKPRDYKYGINNLLMVANARGFGAPYGREIIKDLLEVDLGDNGVDIYGHKWNDRFKYNKVPREWYKGKYIDYEKLNIYYRTAKAVLIDGHQDMFENGFVPMKIYDVFASGGLPIVKYNTGIEELFGDFVPQYRNLKELQKCINLLNNRKKCLKIIRQGYDFVIGGENTYRDRVLQMLKSVRPYVLDYDKSKEITSAEIRMGKVKNVGKQVVKKTNRVEWVSAGVND